MIRRAAAALLLAASECHAATSGLVLGEMHHAESSPRYYDVFSGGVVKCPLFVTVSGRWALTADVSQKGGFLVAPISKGVIVAQGEGSGPFTAELHLPDVKRTTELLVNFRFGPDAAGQPAVFRVYPRALVEEEWRQAVAAKSIHLFGSDTRLRRFLHAHGLVFQDSGAAAPESFEAGQLYIGTDLEKSKDADSDQTPRVPSNGAKIIYIAPRSDLPPGIFATVAGLAKVTFPILDDLENDPLAQEMLINLIKSP